MNRVGWGWYFNPQHSTGNQIISLALIYISSGSHTLLGSGKHSPNLKKIPMDGNTKGEKVFNRSLVWMKVDGTGYLLTPHNRMIKPHELNVFRISVNNDLLNNQLINVFDAIAHFIIEKISNQTELHLLYYRKRDFLNCDFYTLLWKNSIVDWICLFY